MTYPTVGGYHRTPVPPLWSVRWMAFLAFFASQIGTWFTMLVYRVGNFWPVELLALIVAILGTGIAANRVQRGNLYARQIYTLCDNVYGPAADGATVVIRPRPHPEVPGEVTVEYPD